MAEARATRLQDALPVAEVGGSGRRSSREVTVDLYGPPDEDTRLPNLVQFAARKMAAERDPTMAQQSAASEGAALASAVAVARKEVAPRYAF